MYKVSVIVPTINRRTLDRALTSLLHQTYENIEIIVVDDGSMPAVEIRPTTVHIRLAENSGFHAKPRNAGIKLAEGKYICYLDDDDEYHSNHIQLLVEALEKENADFAYGRRQYLNKNGVFRQSQYFEWRPDKTCEPFWLGTCDILHTKKLIYQLGGWNERLRRFGDYELGCRLGRLGAKGAGVNVIITNCYTNNQQMSFQEDRQELEATNFKDTPIRQKWLNRY